MFELISRVPSRYYLAYGSNLDMERMGKRCPYAVVVGTTEIKGYRLLFKKSKSIRGHICTKHEGRRSLII